MYIRSNVFYASRLLVSCRHTTGLEDFFTGYHRLSSHLFIATLRAVSAACVSFVQLKEQ